MSQQITPLPTPPSRQVPALFSDRADAFLGALPEFVAETNLLSDEVEANRDLTEQYRDSAEQYKTTAQAAAASTGIAGKWISGTTYTQGDLVYSLVNYQAYRRKTNGAGTIDPASDSTNWEIAVYFPMHREVRNSNTQLSYYDHGKLIDYSGTFTQTFDTASSLTSGWYCWLKNSGTGSITLEPSGTELIEGLTTSTLAFGQTCLIYSTGTALGMLFRSPSTGFQILPLFHPATATLNCMSGAIDPVDSIINTGLVSGTPCDAVFEPASNLFVVFASLTAKPSQYCSTSPDGETWTLRDMNVSEVWSVAVTPSGLIAIAKNKTTVQISSNGGVTWTTATALPGISKSTVCKPIVAVLGSRIAVLSNTAATIYYSDNNGTSWTTATIPSAWPFGSLEVVGGMFIGFTSATSYYTSTTAETGSWTTRTAPQAPTGSYFGMSGSNDRFYFNSTTTSYYTNNGIDWTDTKIPLSGSYIMGDINGIIFALSYDISTCFIKYSGKAAMSSLFSSSIYTTGIRCNTDKTIFIITGTSNEVAVIKPYSTTTKTGFFGGA